MVLKSVLLAVSLLFSGGGLKADAGPALPFFLPILPQSADEDLKVECPTTDAFCVPKLAFDSEIDEESVDKAIKWMDAWQDAGAKKMVIEWDSPGGSVDDGFKLAKRIENSDIPVVCVVDNSAFSMAAYILESCTTRVMVPRGSLMFHQAALNGQISGREIRFGNLQEMLRVTNKGIAMHCSKRMNVSLGYYESKVRDGREWWMTADEALKYGAADKIVESVKVLLKNLRANNKV